MDRGGGHCGNWSHVFLNTLHTWTAELTVSPLSGCWVDDAEELIIGHGLWIEVHPHGSTLQVLIGSLERPHHLTLPGAGVSDHKHRVTYGQQLLQLHHLSQPQDELFIMVMHYPTRRALMMVHK